MGCSLYGILSIVATSAAVLLTSIALGLPLWSAQNYSSGSVFSNNILVESADRGYGVWGVCSNIELENNIGSADNCFPYYTSKKVETFTTNVLTTKVEFDTSLCSLYDDKLSSVVLPFDFLVSSNELKFLDRMCSSTGKATLAFAVLVPALAFIALALLLIGVTCCAKNGCFVKFSRTLLYFSVVWTILAVAMWAYVSSPLRDNDDVSYGASFYIAIAGIVVTLVSTAFIGCHVKKGMREEVRDNHAAYRSAPNTANYNQPPNTGKVTGPTQLV